MTRLSPPANGRKRKNMLAAQPSPKTAENRMQVSVGFTDRYLHSIFPTNSKKNIE
jgi:hypothetical protein